MMSRLHPAAWAAWLTSAMVIVLVTSNPLYHASAALSALIVYMAVRRGGRSAIDAFLLLGWCFAGLSIPLNLVTGSSGRHELFAVPSLVLPGWLGSVTLGGAVTAESLLYACGQALAVGAIVSVVCAFNAGVDHFQLLKFTPPGLAQLGVVVSVGLLLVPETLARARTLREVRVCRGHADRLTPAMLVPLLSDALERAVARAESLDARGFGAMAVPPRTGESLLALSGLVLAACGAFGWFYDPDGRLWSGAALALGGALVIWVARRQMSRGIARRLFVASMTTADAVVVAASAAAAGAVVAARVAGVGDVVYLPFPELRPPGFHLALAMALALMLGPAIVRADSP